ncbi:GDP-mannose transporter like [Actinidia chinensis var. chinensis]|uniref:GDP-mannose transporter like n=1 Tax=Actinidia chinensis var. chinensis TaxID=1590841 RepID=A0A2R6RJP1_ACTCC|nr:GDP-mannose transporter like [Actinidia chinensis var. chinensis]
MQLNLILSIDGSLPIRASLDSPRPALERILTENIGKGVGSVDRVPDVHEAIGVLDQISSPVRREVVNRSVFTMKTFNNDEIDLEGDKLEKDREKTTRSAKTGKIHNQALLSGLAYCISSCSMILVNKYVLSSYDFNAGISLMLYQNFVSVVIVSLLSVFGVITTEPLTWRLIKVWLPVNVIFVGMLITSMFSLKYINVAMVTVLKNVTNVITAVGEMYLFHKHHDNRVWAALFLMIISAISGGITDLSFHAVGYTWQIINCFLTASYSLTLRRVMDTAKQVTRSGNLNEFSMVLLNNTLSLPLGLLLTFVFNEVDYLSRTPLLRMPIFWLVMTFSGFLGLAISFTSMWFLHQTGATTYSLVGSLNKIPLSVAGIVLFHVPTSLENSASIFFGLVAGVFFARAKMRERSPS